MDSLQAKFFAGLLMLGAVSLPSAAFASASDDIEAIEGTWGAIVTNLVPAPPPGSPTSFLSLATFSAGGQAIEDANTTAIRSVAQGEWIKVGTRQYIRTMYILTYAAPHVFTGMTKAVTKIDVEDNNNEYDGIASFQTYDAAGNLLVTGTNTSHGRRCTFATAVQQCMGIAE